MKFLQKYLPEVFVLPSLIFAFLITRLTNIMSLPIFTDEAIYTRWAQIAKDDSNWRFISLTDGKQPSFVWAQMFLMRFFEDPLLAGRLVSTISGLLVCFGVYLLTREVFKEDKNARIIALVSVTIAVFFPFLLVYDRLAIYESLIAAFFIWALYLQVLLIRRLRLDIAMILGFVLGGAVLTKSSGFLSIYLMPILLILLDITKKTLKSNVLKFVILALVSSLIAYAMYSIQRLSPFFHIIDQKNAIFVYPVSEWIGFDLKLKFEILQSNYRGLFDWFLIYFTPVNAILVVSSFVLSKKFLREKIILVLWFLLPFIALCIFGKTLYPRYILFMVLPLLPLVGYSIVLLFSRYRNVFLRLGIIVIVSFLPLRMMYFIIFDFVNAPIPKSDLEQLINGWPAGGGVSESSKFFEQEAMKGPIFIATQGTFGLMPYAYEINFVNNKKITIKGYWPTDEQMPEELYEIAKTKPTYAVFYQECHVCESPGVPPKSWPLEMVAEYKKGVGKNYLRVFRVLSQ